MKFRSSHEAFYVYTARAARGFGDGFAIIILPAYLNELDRERLSVGDVLKPAWGLRAAVMRGRTNTGRRTIMRTFAALLVLVGHCFVSHTAAAAQSQDCKLCREDYAACVKAHTQGACKTNYDICMNHCRKK